MYKLCSPPPRLVSHTRVFINAEIVLLCRREISFSVDDLREAERRGKKVAECFNKRWKLLLYAFVLKQQQKRIITLWLSHALKFNLCLKAHESGFPTFPASSTLSCLIQFSSFHFNAQHFRIWRLLLNEHQDRRSDIHNWNDLQFYINVFTVSADTKTGESETDEKLCRNYLVNLVPVKLNWFSPSAVHAKIYVHRSNRFQFRSAFSAGERKEGGTWLKS